MLTYHQARQIAEEKLQEWSSDELKMQIIDSKTIEKSYAWIFFYQSEKYLKTGNLDSLLGGNGPLFISKTDGRISTFRTGLSLEGMIEEYEEREKIWELTLTEDIYTDTQKLLDLKRTLALSNKEIADFKHSHQLKLDAGSEARLSELQKSLAAKNIQTKLSEASSA